MSSSSNPIARFFKHSAVYALGSLLNRAAAFLLLPLYTNHLTAAEYGSLELFYVVSAVVSGMLSVGIAHATLRFYFEYDDQADRNAVVSSNLITSLVITGAGAALVALWSQPLAITVFGDSAYSYGIILILITMVFELSSQVCLAYLRAREYSALFVGMALAKLVVQCVANAYFVVVQNAGVQGVLLGNLLAVGAGWIFLVIMTVRDCGLRFSLDKTLPSLKYSFPFLLGTIVGLISSNVDRMMITTYLSLQALGIYALATKFSAMLDYAIGEPFNRSYGAFRFTIMNDASAGEIHSRIVRYLFILSVSAGLGISLFIYEVLSLMSKSEFWPAAAIVPILVIASSFIILSYPLHTGMLFKKRTGVMFYINLAGAVTSACANVLLVPRLGVMGACVAQVITSVVIVVGNGWVGQRYFPVHYQFRAMGTAMGCAIVIFLLSLPLSGQPLSVAIPAKLMLFLLYVLSLWLFRAVTHGEVTWLRGRIASLRAS